MALRHPRATIWEMASYGRIKICGVTTPADARLAALLGADAIGLNFYPASPRYVPASAVEFIVREVPVFVDVVGVFVGERWANVRDAVSRFGRIRTVQWHGAAPEVVNVHPYRHIAAVSVADRDSLRQVNQYLDLCRGAGLLPAAVLVDAHAPGLYGGTGRLAPWDILADFKPDIPVILAGGLNADNVAEAVRIVQPYGVDAASGVESRPGIKDPDKMRRFIDSARAAFSQLKLT